MKMVCGIYCVFFVIVLNDGGITESGTQAALMKQGGRYAEMFKLQAEKYT